MGVGLQFTRMDYGHQVLSEQSPERAVGGGAHGAVIIGQDLGGDDGLRAASEGGAILQEGFMGCGVGCQEDGRARAEVEGDDGAVVGAEDAEKGLDVGEVLGGLEEPEDVAEDGDGGRPWWELLLLQEAEEGMERSSDTERSEEEKPKVHGCIRTQINNGDFQQTTMVNFTYLYMGFFF